MPRSIVEKANNYETCQDEMVSHYMKKFKKGKLKTRAKNVVKSQPQAIAMSLSIANKECAPLMNKNDLMNLERKTNEFLYGKNHGNSNSNKILNNANFNLTDIKNGEKVVNHYLNKGEKNKAQNWANKIYKRVNMATKAHKVQPRLVKETVNIQRKINRNNNKK